MNISGETSLYIALILFIASVCVAFFFGYKPRVRKARVDELQKKLENRNSELVTLYKDIQCFEEIEKNLCDQLGISKQKAREHLNISQRSEPRRIVKRLQELEHK